MVTSEMELRRAADDDADGKGDQRRQDQRIDGQRQRHPEPVADQLGHRHAIGIGNAELTLQQPEDPGEIAFGERRVEPELVTQGFDGLRIGIDAEQ